MPSRPNRFTSLRAACLTPGVSVGHIATEPAARTVRDRYDPGTSKRQVQRMTILEAPDTVSLLSWIRRHDDGSGSPKRLQQDEV